MSESRSSVLICSKRLSNSNVSGAYTPQEQLVGHFEGFTALLFTGSPETCNGICG